MARRSGIGLGSLLLYAGIGYGIYYVAKHGLPTFLRGGPIVNTAPKPGDANYAAYQKCIQNGGLWTMGQCTAGPDYPPGTKGYEPGDRMYGFGTRQPNGTIAWR